MASVIDEVEFKVHPKEKFYYLLKVIATLLLWILGLMILSFALDIEDGVSMLTVVLIYFIAIVLLIIIQMGLLTGYLKGNAVRITPNQFPEISEIIHRQSKQLGLKRPPKFYLLEAGGFINAFATRFMGTNYVVIYSELMEEAYEDNIDTVEFVIAHELGHVKRKHIIKTILLFPSLIVPFLGAAYSRACELTCDNIGYALNKRGAVPGMLILASGRKLWKRVNYDAFVEQEKTERGFWFWFAEKVSSHPRLTRRLSRFPKNIEAPLFASNKEVEKKEDSNDHTKFMPG